MSIDTSRFEGRTRGPWKWWTSNSVKRLSSGSKDGNVLRAYPIDGTADIAVSDADGELIQAAPELLGTVILAITSIASAYEALQDGERDEALLLLSHTEHELRAVLSKAE